MSQAPHEDTARTNMPDELAEWVNRNMSEIDRIERYAEDNECAGRGWTVYARHACLKHLPDGFRFGNVSVSTSADDHQIFRLQLRE